MIISLPSRITSQEIGLPTAFYTQIKTECHYYETLTSEGIKFEGSPYKTLYPTHEKAWEAYNIQFSRYLLENADDPDEEYKLVWRKRPEIVEVDGQFTINSRLVIIQKSCDHE